MITRIATSKRGFLDQISVAQKHSDMATWPKKKTKGLLVQASLTVMLALSMLGNPVKAWWGNSSAEPGAYGAIDGAQFANSKFDQGASANELDNNQKKISSMNVLLPISNCAECRKVKYEVIGSNGCYAWQNSHPQLVSMTDAHGHSIDYDRQPPGECINRVFLEAKTLKETKSIILITARDKNSGTVLKCNVKVGQVNRLDIFTRQTQFSVNSNQQLNVIGYDDDDNVFNSLDGFQFDWTISEGQEIIKKFSAPDTGSKNVQKTDFFFIRSFKPGFASVTVKLDEPGYESIPMVTKKLTVVDPFDILPAEPVYILPTSEFQFSLAHLNMDGDGSQNRPIKIPNPQFKWSTADEKIGSIQDNGKFRSKVTEGEATIHVVDQQMKNNTAEGSIHVVYPYRMEVTIKDVTDIQQLKTLHEGDDVESMMAWSLGLDLFDVSRPGEGDMPELDLADTHILIEQHYYQIKMYLFDKDGHKITLTENLRFKSLNLDEKWIEVVKKNTIGSEIIIKTKKIESEKVKVNSQHKLEEILSDPSTKEKYSQFGSRLTQDKELVITKPVKIQHPTNLVLLPYLPNAVELHGNGEVWNLSSKGGSGVYMWSIVDPKVASVQGSAQVKSVSLGKTQLICRDHKNFNNWDSIEIEVAQLNQLSWVEVQVEIKANSPSAATSTRADQVKPYGEVRVLSLIALDSKGRKFTNCTAVRPSYELKGETFVNLSENYDQQQASSKYSQIKSYLGAKENEDFIKTRQRFDEQSQVIFLDDLKTQKTPELSESLMLHNNFGICAQTEIQGKSEGLARLKASFVIYDYLNGPGRILASEFAEIAVYNSLVSVEPTYAAHMSDLYSVNQLGQEIQSFEGFYQDWKFKLQFGSLLTWRVIGGSNFWPDQAQNYKTSWISESLTNQKDKILDVKTIKVFTSESEFEVTCLAPTKDDKESQRARLTLNQASRSSRSLMRPARHMTSVEVHCEPPKGIKLLWAQEDRISSKEIPLRALPRSRIVQNERTNFVLVDSNHFVRYLMLDQDNMVSFNSSSVLTNVDVSIPTMAEISLLPRDAASRSYQEDVLSGIYDKRLVQFKNITGKVYLTAEASHYLADFTGISGRKEDKGSFWPIGGTSSKQNAKDIMIGQYQSSINGGAIKFSYGPVKNRMAIEVVRNVDVEPKFKSLYIGQSKQTYKLKILHGSGSFSVTVNNTRLVDFVQKDREILLTPKELGGLKIMIEDLELPSSEVATAELLISDIAKLSLWAPLTLIEKGDEMELTVSAFDSFMKEFDADQYAIMNFEIETETMGLRRTGGLQSTKVVGQNRKFNAKGNEPGVYQLTAFTFAFNDPNKKDLTAKKLTVVSEMLRIEVFPLLEIYPSNLLITPNMRYTLQIVGGPQTTAKTQQIDGSHVEIKFDIENKQVATIDRFREVTGHQVGDAILKYEIIQLRTQNNVQPYSSIDQDGKGVLVPVQPQSRVVSKKTIKIRVRLVTEILIPFTHQRQIYAGSLIKMMAVLKFGEELFHHGIAPISYSWNCTEGRVLALDIPTKQELAMVHGIASNLVMTSRYIRDNKKNDNKVQFFTAFNSSSIYARGERAGETHVNVLLAIEYPEKYSTEQNWFKSSVTVKVTDRLTINVPEYSTNGEKQTHMYLVPPHTLTKIETNKQTRLKLGYSQQSVFDYSTQQYKYQESTSPIIELVNDEAIRTFDKYGKVTLLVEEGGAFSDQIVMLNVKIADIYAIATMRSYDALSLPLGSSLTLPIHLQDDHAHLFAEKISGIGIGIYLSHPRVVQTSLDRYNQTLTIQSLGSGDCNVFIFLQEHPHIFDVIRVRVSGVVQPLSPVYLHVGGEINFRVERPDGNVNIDGIASPGSSQVIWSSGNPSILQIDPQLGRASGLREGKADVMLSNHMNAASIVHVSKVAFAQLDTQKSQLIINADNQGSLNQDPPVYRVRIKLFLDKQSEEMMPTVQFNGITLIKQRIGIKCQSDNEKFVMAHGEVNDLEGFFCVMNYVSGADIRGMPRFVKISVTAYGEDVDGKSIYSERVLEFEMQLISDIMIETKFMKGVELCQNHRTESIVVFSSSDFKVDFDYGRPEEGQLVLHSVTPVSQKTNEYNLTIQVPVQVSHSFDVKLILTHQFAQKPRILPLRFLADQNCVTGKQITSTGQEQPSRQVSFEGKENAAESSFGWFSSSAAQEQPVQSAQLSLPPPVAQEGPGWISYVVFTFALIIIIVFVLVQFCNIDLHDLYDIVSGRHGGQGGNGFRPGSIGQGNRYASQQQLSRYQTNLSFQGDGIRDSKAILRKPLSRDQTYSSMGKDYSLGQSGSGFGFRKARTQPLNLDDISLRQGGQPNASRDSRYNDLQNSARYY